MDSVGDRIATALNLLRDALNKDGEGLIEEGESVIGLFNDGVIIISNKSGNPAIDVLQADYIFDFNLFGEEE